LLFFFSSEAIGSSVTVPTEDSSLEVDAVENGVPAVVVATVVLHAVAVALTTMIAGLLFLALSPMAMVAGLIMLALSLAAMVAGLLEVALTATVAVMMVAVLLEIAAAVVVGGA
jgi:hypothetical protein